MLIGYTVKNDAFEKTTINLRADLKPEMVWLDAVNPTEQERQWVRELYGQELLFTEELGEIEASARFYRDGQGLHLHLYFLLTGEHFARNVNVAFSLHQDRLFTLRSDDLPEFRTFVTKAQRDSGICGTPASVLIGMIATRTEGMADRFEKLQGELETLSASVFRANDRTVRSIFNALAKIEDTNSKARLGLLENRRAYALLVKTPEAAPHVAELNEIMLDIDSIVGYASFLIDRTKFLMDAAIGSSNISQARRLNIFTVLSVVLMPPTLIASIYGMNFEHMPELKWLLGYPMALILMVCVAVGPILYLRKKGML
ncbi:MAG: CorA family divalent cation transporter [Burkholderiales bacterium]